jgi:ParB family transcriptional regulator, chromosome partitioning protein
MDRRTRIEQNIEVLTFSNFIYPLFSMALKKRSSADLLQAATAAGTAIEQQDRQSEVRSLQAKVFELPLHKIIDRLADTRELNHKHVEELMESISVLGLLEALVVDMRGRLLAGGHRKAAIYLLKERHPGKYIEHFDGELVSIKMLPFDAELDPELALLVEISENEKRRDYTPAEVRKLAERLKVAGYSDNKGRPAAGSKPLRPALTVIIGKNIRTVQRYLNKPEEKSQTNVRLFPDASALTSLKSNLVKWQKVYGGSDDEIVKSIALDVTKLLKRLETGIKKSLSPAIESSPIHVTTPHGSTIYAEMVVQEKLRIENGNEGIIDIVPTSESSDDDPHS